MKRRNVDCGKIRRPVKRNKITEGIYGSTLMYLKFLIIWVIVILADFLLEFRFEFLWPFWLLLRSVYDSFKYQGLAFSVFFICIAVTSDMVCFFFIPVQWLFFAASTYVWVQYVWHTDKGICMPTIILWILFVYMEAAVRLRDMRHLPFHLDLCRPFAAHCIGYPVVTLGFGFKSYVGYRMRQRKQKDVAKENEFYAQLLQQALPIEQTGAQQASATTQTETVTQPVNSGVGGKQQQQQQTSNRTQPSSDKSRTSETHNSSVTSNGTVQNGTIPQTSNTKNNHRKSVDKINDHNKHKEHNENHINTDKTNSSSDNKRYIHANGSVNHDSDFVERNVNELDETDVEKEKVVKTVVQNKSNKYDRKENSNQNCQRKNKEKHKDALQAEREKEAEYMQRLEWDVKRLRADLQASRGTELELRSQVNSLTTAEKNVRTELSQLQHDHEELQNKLQNVASARAAERQALERRAAEDRRTRAALEVQLAHERRSQQQAQHQHNKGECTEQCRQRRRELENEVRELRSTVRAAEERLGTAERERTQQQHDTDILMSALSAMQDKNQHLEDSLSAETRIKLDLFSALGEAKRQLEIRENVIRSQEKEIEELKSKIAQVLAVMPSDTFGSPTPSSSSSRVRLAESPPVSVATPQSGASSTLDPNATAYTPKGSLVAGTEA